LLAREIIRKALRYAAAVTRWLRQSITLLRRMAIVAVTLVIYMAAIVVTAWLSLLLLSDNIMMIAER